jgi:hypothetical protein
MRYLLILAVVLVSLCTGLPEIPFINSGNTSIQQAGLLIIDAESPDAFVRVDYQPEVITGRPENILFDIENKNNFNLENVDLTIYDPCVFTGDTTKNIGEIKANRSATFSLKLTAGNTDLDKDCNVKFKLSYNTSYSLFQDIAVLSQSEYEQREAAGTLNDIPIQSSSPSSPFKISLTLLGEQPFINGEKYYMSINYANIGSGFIEVKKYDIGIATPTNIKDFTCSDDYISTSSASASASSGGFSGGASGRPIGVVGQLPNFILNKDLIFISNRAPTSTCTFTASTSQPMDIKSLTITASYKYVLYNSILIKVKRK